MTEEEAPMKIVLPGLRADKPIPKRKLVYAEKLKAILKEYNKALVVTVDNVASNQVQAMRKQLRGRGRFLFGKNTLVRKVIREFMKETGNRKLMGLLDLVAGNSGFCFTKGDIKSLRDEITARKRQCPAKAGAVAPEDVSVQPGPTGMEPTMTSFFQAMDIPTRINRGQIDITDPVQVIFKGTKVGASEASLLMKLGIRPFWYGPIVQSVYDDGDAYSAVVLDLTDNDIANAFFVGCREAAALCFGLNMPTLLNVPHSTMNAYKKLLALGLGLETYSWENLALVKEILANPDAFKAAAAPAAGGDGGAEAAKVEEESEPEESSDAAPAGGMFGGDSSDESSDDDESS